MGVSLWLSFALVSSLNIVTPGPANLNTVQRAMQLGWRSVQPTILGNAMGLAVGGTACALGLSALLLASDLIWDLLEKAGQLYLIWLGSKLFWTPERLVFASAVQQQGTRPQTLFQEAFLLAVINPKALLFFVALFPQSVDPNESFTLQITFLILTYCGLSICSLNTYAALATGLRSGVTQTRYTYFRKLSGLALVCFALTLSTS